MDQKNALATREHGRNLISAPPMDSLICPKPQRIRGHFRPSLRRQGSQLEASDFKAGMELLDLIRAKESCGPDHPLGDQIASPFFSGSPPRRVSNPVVHDENFGNWRCSPLSPVSSSSASITGRRAGCARVNFGPKPAAVRIEGFDCLSRDRRNCSISAVA